MLLFVVCVIKMLCSLYIDLQFVDIQSFSWMNETWGNDGRWHGGDPLQHIRTDFPSTTTKGIAPAHRGGLQSWVSGKRSKFHSLLGLKGNYYRIFAPKDPSCQEVQLEIWMRDFSICSISLRTAEGAPAVVRPAVLHLSWISVGGVFK